jgi:MoaA/NifB/PqqE/SkfB family radical SAM enzyme
VRATSGTSASFRDPPDVTMEAQRRKVNIVRALVGATALPLPLPRFGLELLDVEANGTSIDLLVGERFPVASVRISASEGPHAVRVEARETQPSAVRYRRALGVMRERLELGISREKWLLAKTEVQALRKLPTDVPLSHFRQVVEGIAPPAGLVRTGFLCNQDCGFCWQSREWPGYDGVQLRTWIEDLRALGVDDLTISGGEPTLDRELAAHIRHAKSLGISRVVIETNAIQIGKRPALATELQEAGLDRAFVSFHSGNAEVSDAETRAPGTHAKTVAGIHALLAAKVHVILNAVITRATLSELPALPGYVRRTFARGWLGGITISIPTHPYERALAASIVPEPEAMRDALARTIDAASQEGILLFGLDGPCGPPLCAYGADTRVTDLSPKSPLSFRGHVTECERCSVRGSCHGVRNEDYARFGTRAVLPIARTSQ